MDLFVKILYMGGAVLFAVLLVLSLFPNQRGKSGDLFFFGSISVIIASLLLMNVFGIEPAQAFIQ